MFLFFKEALSGNDNPVEHIERTKLYCTLQYINEQKNYGESNFHGEGHFNDIQMVGFRCLC